MSFRANFGHHSAFLRRRGLIGAMVAAAAAPLWTVFSGLAPAAERNRRVARRLLRVLANIEGARRVGAAWLARHPSEGDIGRLLASLRLPADRFSQAVEQDRLADMRGALPQRIADDFTCGRVVRVEGWLLAETEIRLCALAAVTPGQAGDRAIAG
jgi:hypothetical protein